MFWRSLSKKKCLGALVALTFFLGGVLTWHTNQSRTDGFGPNSIFMNSSFEPQWDYDVKQVTSSDALRKILAQRYRYIGKGTQSYVLASQDGLYVIKFFKKKHLHIAPWVQKMLQVPLLSQSINAKIQRRETRKKELFMGCITAARYIPEQSGLVYLHLNPGQIPYISTLSIVDKQGGVHQIELASTSFVIQRLGKSALDQLRCWRDNREHEEARDGLAALFHYLVERSKKGILDRDTNYGNNLGFVNGRVVTLDLGRLVHDELIMNPAEYKRRIATSMAQVRFWVSTYYPELLQYYDRQIELLNSDSI